MRNSTKQIIVAAAGGLVIIGCAKKNAPTVQPQLPPNPQPKMETSVTDRVTDLQKRVDDFESKARNLPGRSDDEHRQMMAEVFGDLSGILPLIEGPEPGGAFRVQL